MLLCGLLPVAFLLDFPKTDFLKTLAIDRQLLPRVLGHLLSDLKQFTDILLGYSGSCGSRTSNSFEKTMRFYRCLGPCRTSRCWLNLGLRNRKSTTIVNRSEEILMPASQ
jgi:hypothetical protein